MTSEQWDKDEAERDREASLSALEDKAAAAKEAQREAQSLANAAQMTSLALRARADDLQQAWFKASNNVEDAQAQYDAAVEEAETEEGALLAPVGGHFRNYLDQQDHLTPFEKIQEQAKLARIHAKSAKDGVSELKAQIIKAEDRAAKLAIAAVHAKHRVRDAIAEKLGEGAEAAAAEAQNETAEGATVVPHDVPRGTLDDVSEHETMQDKVQHAAEVAAAAHARAQNSRQRSERAAVEAEHAAAYSPAEWAWSSSIAAINARHAANLERQEAEEAGARLMELQKQMLDDAEVQGQEAENDALEHGRKVGPWLSVAVRDGQWEYPHIDNEWHDVERRVGTTHAGTYGKLSAIAFPIRWIMALPQVLVELGQCHALLRELEPKAVEDGIVHRQICERAEAVGGVIAKCRAQVDTSHAMDAVEYSKGPDGGEG